MNHDQRAFQLTDRQSEVRRTFAKAYMFHLVYGGSRSGKTFLIVYTILTRAIKAPGSRHAIFRNDGVDAKQAIAMDTLPKVVELAYPDLPIKWRDKDGYFALGNGSEIWVAGLKDKERLDKVLGKEYATIYLNEASQIALAAFELVKTRLAQSVAQTDGRPLKLKMYVDLNPTTSAHWTYQVFVLGIHPDGGQPIPDHEKDYHNVTVNPMDNQDNLPRAYLATLQNMPERQRRRFFEGAYSADDDNALWRRSYIKVDEDVPKMQRIVVAIDPAITNEVGSDETGIVVAGLGEDGRGYLLDDGSSKYRPEEWARRAISLFDTWDADRMVAEVNQGGDMVEATIKAQARGRVIPYTAVTATRAKQVRAEPIAALYEQGKIRHVQSFPQLEDQMCSFTLGFDRKAAGYSPDRVDALVWAFTALFPQIAQNQAPSGPIPSPRFSMV
jgi:predicted phage terminase large subunit-like protein